MTSTTTSIATQMCQLSFHLRVHGKASDKSVTISKESNPQNHLLTPLGGATGMQAPHQKLLLLIGAHPPEISVAHTSPLNERHLFEAARQYVTTNLVGYDVDPVIVIGSRWNPSYNRWDQTLATDLAFGYLITVAGGQRIESFCTAGVQTLFVDFVIHLQRNAP